ncbi:Proteophosphoglycan ppg4 [Rhodotorula diobovata]|uniref:Proteophosphoglycan ppg4 n=1 Tax=Rhodotorula diobovata TaxID=5288 RepID=A0A5C5FN94_9BASI|nr:Proteophosphoglycan ppg4 [Rhodotorula diobovata]
MNEYTHLFQSEPSAKGAFDEAAADLTAFLDFSSYSATAADSIVVPEVTSQQAPGAPMGALRPVDDSLLDSPLDLELSPASSFASSISGSPFDLAVDFTSPMLSSFESPLLESFSLASSSSVAGEYPSLFAPAPGADFLASSSFAMATEPQWTPQDIQLPALPQVGGTGLPLPTSSPMMEDVKPVITSSSSSPPVLARNDSALFDTFTAVPVAAQAAWSTPAPAPAPRKSVAQLRKEAAQAMPEQSFKKDKFTGVRNTRKPMIDLDAPTLPKNYLTESATSKKRGGSAKYAASIVNKRQRSTASATPGPELPQTRPDPIDAEALDEEQLTAIEMKRRSNTLAARKSRMRKAQHIADMQDEIARLQSLNETLQAELAAARAGCTCPPADAERRRRGGLPAASSALLRPLQMSSASSSAAAAPSDKSLLPSLRLGSLDELLVGAVLKAGGPSTVQGSKEALSLGSTTVNFRRFVQKSGPIFVAQDAVEAVLRWEDPAKTVFFASAWALLCYWPSLVIFVPNLVLVAVLLSTYHAKRAAGPPPDSQEGPTPLAKDPPGEMSVDYLSNLQNIQIMMGRVADLSDALRSTVPLLTWRDERLTRALLQLAVVSSLALAFIAPLIPWRLVFLVLGEGAFLLSHPLAQTFLADATARLQTPQARKARQQATRRLLEDDALRDDELDLEVVEVQRLEVESRAPGASVAGAKEGEVWGNEAIVGGELPTGFRWLGEWEDAAPADGAVDADGWTYIHLDGTRTSTPFVLQGDKATAVWAQSRRRRLTRRAIRNPLL